MAKFRADPKIIENSEDGLGETTLSWEAPIKGEVEIRVGSEQGPLFATGGHEGSARTGRWVKDQTVFILLDSESRETLATAVVRVQGKPAPTLEELSEGMRKDWDRRARENALYYVASGNEAWSEDEFFETGRRTFEETFRNDMLDICRGRDPRKMRVLEIGCGVGRILRAAAEEFGEVCGVDVSREMIEKARRFLASCPNASLFVNNGVDLKVLGERRFDFAYSLLCFQHIPSKQVIESYIREAARLLRPGGLFKFQVQGYSPLENPPDDSWLGAAFSRQELTEIAHRCGFQPRHFHGENSQYFFAWFYKKGPASLCAQLSPASQGNLRIAQADLSWDAPSAEAVEIRLGSATGKLVEKAIPYGSTRVELPGGGRTGYVLLDADSRQTLARVTVSIN